MPEINDVTTLTTISADWGNSIRDRVLMRYASVAGRTTEHPSPVEGDLSYLEDSNTVWVYNGSAWVELFSATIDTADITDGAVTGPKLAVSALDIIRAGGAQDGPTATALTGTMTDKASVVFTKPAAWTTYALVAWGVAVGIPDGAGGSITARVEIGTSNGATNAGITIVTESSVPCFHSVTAQTASPVTVAVAVAESGGDATYRSSTIQYVAYRLT